MAFYVVNNHRFDNNEFAYGEEKGKITTGNAIYCEECNSPLTMLEWLPPFEIKVSKKNLGDVIFGTFTHFVVSAKFKALYENNNFTGIYSFNPVNVYWKGKLLDVEYYYPKITLSYAHINLIKSGIKFEGKEQCSTCQRAGRNYKDMKRLYFEKAESITEAIFCTIVLPGDIVFSDHFKFLTLDLTNLSFIKADEYKPSWVLSRASN